MELLLSPDLKRIDNANFLNELQYQVNCFFTDPDAAGVHTYTSAILPLAIEIYFDDEKTIIAKSSNIGIEYFHKIKNGGRY